MNFQENVALCAASCPSLVSLENESQVDDDDDDEEDDDEEDEEAEYDNLEDDRSLSSACSAGGVEPGDDDPWTDGATAVPAWRRLLHALSKVRK